MARGAAGWLQWLVCACAARVWCEMSSYGHVRPGLTVRSTDDAGWNDVLVKRAGDPLTLTCEAHGAARDGYLVWNVLAVSPHRAYNTSQLEDGSSKLEISTLGLNDTGHYICAAPTLSLAKYIVVQPRHSGVGICARGGFSCGHACVLPRYVCDGHADCPDGEDEARQTCGTSQPCDGKLNCSNGRCMSEVWCCDRLAQHDCVRPSCCDQYLPVGYGDLGQADVRSMLDADRPSADDYGFIQTTIYTVTACALIFMIAVVLLVSAICKMHMKRAALRSYACTERQLYGVQCTQARYPPCYEASRLLEPEQRATPAATASPTAPSPAASPIALACPTVTPSPATSPQRQSPAQAGLETAHLATSGASDAPRRPTNFGFGRLADSIFNSRYRPVPTHAHTQYCDVEMTSLAHTETTSSPARNNICLDSYTSPAFYDLNDGDFYFANTDTGCYGRDLNYMSTPLDFLMTNRDQHHALRRVNAVERILDRLSLNTSYRVDTMEQNYGHGGDARALTLQLGRFQLSLPRFTRQHRQGEVGRGPRPDTPNVAELNIDDLDFVRLNSNETYTLNGRTIRLLGASFENYPSIVNIGNQTSFVGRVIAPPPYSAVVAAAPSKVFGPPPAYLSRENLTTVNATDAGPNINEASNESSRLSLALEISAELSTDSNGNIEHTDGRISNAEPPPRYEEATGTLDNCNSLDANANIALGT